MIALLLLLIAFCVLSILTFRIARGQLSVRLRASGGASALRQLPGRAIEEGQTVHLGLGTGRLDGVGAAETLAGFIVLDWLAEQAARTGQRTLVTTADPAAALIAQDQLRAGDIQRGWRALRDSRFIAPDPAAYGIGARGVASHEAPRLGALFGHFGDEYLLLAAEQPAGASPLSRPVVVGSARLETLPQIVLTADQSLPGERLFTVGATLACLPAHVASLVLQDGVRVVLVVAILVGVLVRTLGG